MEVTVKTVDKKKCKNEDEKQKETHLKPQKDLIEYKMQT